jgi:hypothetical protein
LEDDNAEGELEGAMEAKLGILEAASFSARPQLLGYEAIKGNKLEPTIANTPFCTTHYHRSECRKLSRSALL